MSSSPALVRDIKRQALRRVPRLDPTHWKTVQLFLTVDWKPFSVIAEAAAQKPYLLHPRIVVHTLAWAIHQKLAERQTVIDVNTEKQRVFSTRYRLTH